MGAVAILAYTPITTRRFTIGRFSRERFDQNQFLIAPTVFAREPAADFQLIFSAAAAFLARDGRTDHHTHRYP